MGTEKGTGVTIYACFVSFFENVLLIPLIKPNPAISKPTKIIGIPITGTQINQTPQPLNPKPSAVNAQPGFL